MGHVIVAVAPSVDRSLLLDHAGVMLDAYGARPIDIEDEELTTDNLEPPNRRIVAHANIPSMMDRPGRVVLDRRHPLFTPHVNHFERIISAQYCGAEIAHVLLLILSATDITPEQRDILLMRFDELICS